MINPTSDNRGEQRKLQSEALAALARLWSASWLCAGCMVSEDAPDGAGWFEPPSHCNQQSAIRGRLVRAMLLVLSVERPDDIDEALSLAETAAGGKAGRQLAAELSAFVKVSLMHGDGSQRRGQA